MCNHHEHCESCEHSHSKENALYSLVRIALAICIFVFSIFMDFSGILKFFLFFIAYVIAGYDVIFTALKNIFKGEVFDENFLMSIATIGAFAIKEYPEAVMVMILYQIGEFLQDKAVENSKKSITSLMDIRPDYANVIENGQIIQKSPEAIKISDEIIVKAGEKIPLDGIVTEGFATVDASALTGESVPQNLKIGDAAISGCINTNGLIKIKVTKLFQESTVSKILELVENVSSKKAKTEHFITKFAKIYTPVVVLAALVMAVAVPLFTGDSFILWIQRALTFLVISCPCAFVISVPLSFFAGIGGMSKAGILVKGSQYIEALSKPDFVVFDKTGTLTKGNFSVKNIFSVKPNEENFVLEYATMAEYYSNHPIAVSLKNAYKKDINPTLVTNFKEISGNGVSAEIDNQKVLVGNDKLMNAFNISYDKADENGTVVYVSINDEFRGYIIIADEIKYDSKIAVSELKNLGCKTVMLTGDSECSAKYIAEDLCIDKFYSKLLPADKVNKLEQIKTDACINKSVIFVGDGINDAPVLTAADVGVAMGALGSDAAIEAADVVIMDDKPSKVSTAIKMAQKTMSIVRQNIAFAIGIKVLFLILGAVGFITMWGAVFADVGVTLIAVMNALRALKSD